MKRAFFVLGPESSGTRLMTQILIAAGCEGDAGHVQRWDTQTPTAPLIVWRRSLPHGGKWPNLFTLFAQLTDNHYVINALIMSRDWHALARSQVAAGHTINEDQAWSHCQTAYSYIFSTLTAIAGGFEIVNYEALTQRPELTVARLLDRLGLVTCAQGAPDVAIHDGNAKYYPRESLRAMAQASDAATLQARIENAFGCEVTVDHANALLSFVEELTA